MVSVLSGCGGFVSKPTIYRPESLVLPIMPTDEELSCLSVEVFSRVISRDSSLFHRVLTLEGQIDAHNDK